MNKYGILNKERFQFHFMTTKTDTLFLLDGHALIYRSYYGMRKRAGRLKARDGTPTETVYGFCRVLLDMIKAYRPSMLAVAFDSKEQTLRQEGYEAYKANRKPPPEDMIVQFPLVEELVEAFAIPTYKWGGYEADDLIGTIAKKASKDGFKVFIVTGDRDLFQLIDDNISVLMPDRNNSGQFLNFNAAAVLEKYSYTPEQVIDYKALAGDSSDNIPGVRGIGDKSALKLLGEFGTLSNIYENLENVPEKFRKKLVADKENAFKSQELATILTDVDLPFEPERCELHQPDTQVLISTLKKLEFNSILAKLEEILSYFHGETEAVLDVLEQHSDIRLLKPQVEIVTTLERVKEVAEDLKKSPFALDLETTSLKSLEAKLVGIALGLPGENGSVDANKARCYYLPVGHELNTIDPIEQLPLKETLMALKEVFEAPEYPKYGHHLKYDINVLSRYDIYVDGICDDTMILDYVLHPDSKHGLKDLASTCLNYNMQPISDLIGEGRKQITMAEVLTEPSAQYAGADVAVTQELRAYFLKQLTDSDRRFLYREIECPLAHVLALMEQAGVHLDTEFLATLSQKLGSDLGELETDIHALAQQEFNVNSPKQLSEILFEKMQLPTKGIKKTKSGYSTDVKTLEKLRQVHPIAEKLLDYRQFSKLKSTYVDALPALVNSESKRLHTTFHQTGAITGRLSSSNPNLQNIPIRTSLGRQIRKAFTSDLPDTLIVSFDYSQIELRLLAHFSEDPLFMQAFKEDRDIHSQTAMDIFNLPSIESVTSEMRRIAKTTNFGIVYGQSVFGLANTLNIPRREAERLIQQFKQRYVGIQAYIEDTLQFARENGYVETLLHRRRHLDDIYHSTTHIREFAERMAINTPLQGTAADLIKLAMVHIAKWLKENEMKSRMLIQVHDELVFEVFKTEYDSLVSAVIRLMENVYPLNVPLKIDRNEGKNWMEAK